MSEAVLLRRAPPGPPDPSVNQREASDPGASVWVGASAGSGKTTVLTARVLRLLLAGVAPQKILCLTFTRAAAAEMAIRAAERLGKWATCSDNELRADLDDLQGAVPEPGQLKDARRLFAEVLACPGGMRIHTIHAFGQEILRRFPLEAGVAPHFGVIEEEDARNLQDDVTVEMLEDALEPGNPLAAPLRILVGGIGEQGFGEAMRGMLADRARFTAALEKAGGAEKLALAARKLLGLEPGDTPATLTLRAVKELPAAEMKEIAQKLLKDSGSFAERGQEMLNWLALPEEERVADFETWQLCFLTKEGTVRAKLASKKLLTADPALDAALQHEAARLQSVGERIEAAEMAEMTGAILALGTELLERYTARKAAQALLDYEDLVAKTRLLLKRPGIGPWVLYKLDGGVDHILVDEAQDTSRAQWDIIASLADEFFAGAGAEHGGERTLFAVGDEKQSIFSFQHADPAAFAGMRDFFRRRITDAEKEYREVPLHVSFRSAPKILLAVDAVFADPEARSGVSKEAVEHFPAPLRRGELPKIGRVEVWKLLPPPEAGESAPWSLAEDYEREQNPRALLAQQIAVRIKGWLDKKERLASQNRPIAPGDIMILLRRRGTFATLMVRALKALKVPVTGVDRMKLVKQLPVMDLLVLIQFALLPEDDLTLAAILRGPLLGLGEEQLMTLAIGRKGTLWQSLGAAADDPAFATVNAYLARLLGRADLMTPFALLGHILNEPCPANSISGRQALWARLGTDALDPIDELLNAAQEFGRRAAPSLQSFLHWLTASETEIKRELDRGGGQVRIMTVHAAKGLEAPIVFLPDTGEVPRARELPRWLWDDSNVPLYVARRPGSGAGQRRWTAARDAQMEEYRRLLYVALTRAKDRLYIGGWEAAKSEGENSGASWHAVASRALRGLHEDSAVTEGEPLIAFADRETAPPEETAGQKTAAAEIVLPDWARRAAPPEPAQERLMAPSRLVEFAGEFSAASPDRLFARGRIIHRLLEILPDIEDLRRDNLTARFLANPLRRLKPEEQKEIAAEVLGLLRDPAYAPLFGPGSRAEVPLAGHIDGNPAARQIDRLCFVKNEVWIVDYKSNRPPPASPAGLPPAYRRQLDEYRALLSEIYPDKPLRCFLLWTYKPYLMEIPEEKPGA